MMEMYQSKPRVMSELTGGQFATSVVLPQKFKHLYRDVFLQNIDQPKNVDFGRPGTSENWENLAISRNDERKEEVEIVEEKPDLGSDSAFDVEDGDARARDFSMKQKEEEEVPRRRRHSFSSSEVEHEMRAPPTPSGIPSLDWPNSEVMKRADSLGAIAMPNFGGASTLPLELAFPSMMAKLRSPMVELESSAHVSLFAGTNFKDPLFTRALASGLPKRVRGEKKATPVEEKDGRYFERRKKNNMAAKKSRDNRKNREENIALRAHVLERENSVLKTQVETLRDEAISLKDLLLQKRIVRARIMAELELCKS